MTVRYVPDIFDADGQFYVFDRVDHGAECAGPFTTFEECERVAASLNAPAAIAEAHGFKVTVTRSDGPDRAVLIFIDGPDEGPMRERDEMPDGSPRCRVRLNDHAIYAPVGHDAPAEDASSIEADPMSAQRKGL